MKSLAVISAVVAIAATAMPGVADARDVSGSKFRIRARVPVSCWVQPKEVIVAEDGNGGSVVEACNSPGGYSVTANYRHLSRGERAQMVYNNRPISLSPSGNQLLRRSNMATIKTVDYHFRNVSMETPLTVYLMIQPL